MTLGYGWREAIGEATRLIPVEVDCRWLFRDPVFAGLHQYNVVADGRSYRNTGHTVYPWHITGPASRRLTTVVLPRRPDGTFHDVETVVHELGHVVDWMFRFDRSMTPVSRYATNSRMEAFAEGFTAWLVPGYGESPLVADDVAWMERVVA